MKAGNVFKPGMGEYCKMILGKIAFDRRLFWKEYRKSFRYLDREEQDNPRKWVREKVSAEAECQRGFGDTL